MRSAVTGAGRGDGDDPVRVFTGPRVLALDGSEPEALATRGEWIVATGTRTELADRFPAAERVDLDGALVVPGFNDAHCHPSQVALAKVRVDLAQFDGRDAVCAALRARAAVTPPGEWVAGQGLDEHRAGGLDRHVLDAVSREHPIVVVHYSLHRAVVNTRGLERLGYRRAADAPSGGALGADADGVLDGRLIERAWLDGWLPGAGNDSVMPEPEQSAALAALTEVNEQVHATGITSYCDAIVTPTERRMYQAAAARGALTPRVGMLVWHSYFDPDEWLRGPSDTDDLRLRLAGVKLMLDGALSGGTCLCLQSYASPAGRDNGLQVLSDREFADAVRAAHAAGARVAVHANGDLAVTKVLDVLEALPARQDPINHRIEHCSIVDEQLIRRIRDAGVTPVPFGAFIARYGDTLTELYGRSRAERACAHRSLREAGLVVAGSSDYPVTPIDPLLAVQSMVTRQSPSGRVLGAAQRLTVREALAVYTAGSAHATGEAARKGVLAPGQLADFTVLDRDLTAIPQEEISTVRPSSTWVGARQVYPRS